MKRLLAIATASWGILSGIAAWGADDPLPPNRVEEDWETVIALPDVAAQGPQLTTCMTPNSGEPGRFIAFGVNYRLRPTAQPGGLQVLAWNDETLLGHATQGDAPLSNADETITWTQELSIVEGQATYRVKAGQSQTWGPFGADDQLRVVYSTGDTDLSRYDPEQTATRSAATWQGDHVTRMVLVRVRFYRDARLLETRELSRPVELAQ